MAYRESDADPDLGARESDAIRAFGLWSTRLRTAILAGFAIAGVAAGFGAGALTVVAWQGQRVDSPPRIVYVGAFVLTMTAFVFVGRANRL